jgi:uncharacterized repeat protein (TIGR03803 family)
VIGIYKLSFCSLAIIAGVLVATLSLVCSADANQEKILYNFAGGADGAEPQGDLIKSGDILYGTTIAGGGGNCVDGCGTVYKVQHGQVNLLYAFKDLGDGAYPAAGLVANAEGDLYGATVEGGEFGSGTLFKLTADGTKTLLYSFTGGRDGQAPNGDLVADSEGNFYGTTKSGGEENSGCTIGCGTAFKITPGGQLSLLHVFSGTPGGDGASPNGGLIADAEGNFYGTSFTGGIAGGACYNFGCGTLFKMTPQGDVTVLYAFHGGNDGKWPFSPLIADAEGNLYGTTSDAGDGGGGTVFKITPEGQLSVIYSFSDSGGDGRLPVGKLLPDAHGNLYGITAYGGSGSCLGGCGTVFKVTPDGHETLLYEFGSFSGDGKIAVGRLARDRQGNLIGATAEGGTSDRGTIFKVRN